MFNIRFLPFLLYSYIAAELLAPFFASFLILYSIFFLVRLTPMLEIVLELGIGFTDFIRLSAYIFPYMLLYVIPMASMTGVIIGFTRMTNENEILAFKSCGINLKQVLPPVIIIALTISVVTGFFSVRLIPAGETSVKQLMFQLAKKKIDKGIKEREFSEALGELVVYVDSIDPNGNWQGVYVSDMRNRQQPVITTSATGNMEAQLNKMQVTIILNDGAMHYSTVKDNQVIKFDRYQLQVPLTSLGKVKGRDITHVGRGAMSQQELLQAAQHYGPKTKKGITYLTEYHHRYVLPVGCFLLSLLGLPLGLQAGPGRKAAGIPLGLGFFVLYYVAFTSFRVMCEDQVLPVVAGMWMPNVIFLFITIFVFRRVEKELPILPEKIQNFFTDLYDSIIVPCKKFIAVNSGKIFFLKKIEKDKERLKDTFIIRANAHSRIFHFPECKNYSNKDCGMEFNNVQVAQQAGFEPCRFCKTLLNKHDQ
ncbi:MAG: LptF/LptG family permease [Desulfobulbaceae bacterium]|nr:LptF/LptG family permease [Desulfobulbaceae bacterium]